jgi:hypothetical protein
MTKTIADNYETDPAADRVRATDKTPFAAATQRMHLPQTIPGVGHGDAFTFAGARAEIPAAPPPAAPPLDLYGLKDNQKYLKRPAREKWDGDQSKIDEPIPYGITTTPPLTKNDMVRLHPDAVADAMKAIQEAGQGPNHKPSNPKDALGIKKAYLSTVPLPVLMELGIAMLEGAIKYRRHNYRIVGVRASVYFDAAIRHLFQWFEGEDIDPDSGLSHLTKAMACMTVLRDAMMQDKFTDDRPPPSKSGWMIEFNKAVEALMQRMPPALPPCTKDDVGGKL